MNSLLFVIVLVASLSSISKAALSSDMKTEILNTHNQYRGGVNPTAGNMVELKWNNDLAKKAQEWADSCAWTHDTYEARKVTPFSYVGQNIGKGAGELLAFLKMWDDEKAMYTYSANACSTQYACVHYTQNVWAKTTDIGCGHSTCIRNSKNKDFLVCNYGPAGNFNNQKPYKSGTPCSSCPAGYNGGCKNNMCTLG